MYYLVVLYDNIIGNYEYVISESKSACKNLENNKKFVDCKVYNSKGYLLDSAIRVENNKIEKSKCFNDGECRERYAAIYAKLKGKVKKIIIGKEYIYKTNLQTDNYKGYYNNSKIRITGLFEKDNDLNKIGIKAYEGYFVNSPDKVTIVVFDINLY